VYSGNDCSVNLGSQQRKNGRWRRVQEQTDENVWHGRKFGCDVSICRPDPRGGRTCYKLPLVTTSGTTRREDADEESLLVCRGVCSGVAGKGDMHSRGTQAVSCGCRGGHCEDFWRQGCHSIQSPRLLPTFRRTSLSPSSG
jgi:hypothetical protein